MVVRRGRAWWHLRANIAVITWLSAALVLAALHPWVAVSGWLLTHVLLLGSVTNAILVWSNHFAVSVLHLRYRHPYRGQALRLGVLNLGVVLVLTGAAAAVWPAIAVGAALAAVVAVWHGAVLTRQVLQAVSAGFRVVVWFYVVATACFVAGLILGALLAGGSSGADAIRARLVVAHVCLHLLGWMGLTIVGTLPVLWPSMLRIRGRPRAARMTWVSLAVLPTGLALTTVSVLADRHALSIAGIVGYLTGLCIAFAPLAAAVRQRRPSSYAGWSVLAGCGWFVGSLLALADLLVRVGDWRDVRAGLHPLIVPFAVGFIVQVLVGALSYLVPVVRGGGAGSVKLANRRMIAAGRTRAALFNAGLVVALLPVLPTAFRTIGGAVVVLVLAAFVVLVVRTWWAGGK